MNQLNGRLIRLSHLSDEAISRLVSGELSTLRSFIAQAHLEKCWRCRAKRDAFERAAMRVTVHRDRLVEQLSSNPQRRATLLADLHQRVNQAETQPSFFHFICRRSKRAGISMNPVLGSAVIILIAIALLTWIWQRNPLTVNAAQLLSRAESFDLTVQHGKPGVIYQRVRITAPDFKTEREIYRDAQGVRHRRPELAQAKLESMQSIFSSAGLDWNEPLSATSYREWHDRQVSVSDTVSKTDGNLLTLVTRTSDTGIEQESLTVRVSDFHPVERTIQTSSNGTIEIAEVNYAVLDWSGVNEALFESLDSPHPGSVLPLPSSAPISPTLTELDNTELGALVVLNQLHADAGEQIGVKRTNREIAVSGVVDTAQRKQEIVAALRPLPYVAANILSVDDTRNISVDSASSAHPARIQPVDVQASPLEEYLNSRGMKRSALNDASQSLLDAALKVRQSAGELDMLKTRFAALSESPRKHSVEAQLAHSYSERLLAGLSAEDSTLRRLGLSSPKFPSDNGSLIDLKLEVNRNEARCRELIAGNAGTTRSVPDITAEIFESIARIREALAETRQSQQ